MTATIQKWGNSRGVRIPKVFLDELDMRENDKVEIICDSCSITIRKAERPRHITLEERLTEFYGLPVQDIPREAAPEFDWGNARGNEVW